jgi:yecA family protein
MQAATSPSLEELSTALQGINTDCSGSELHGVLTGLLAGGARLNRQALVKALEVHAEGDQAFDNQMVASLWQLQLQTLEDLNASELLFAPLLPDDDEGLVLRVQALSDWCQGFLVGFGTAVKPSDRRLQEESVRDTLQDVVNIANVDTETAGETGEADEVAYAELFEFVRMATIHLFEELAPAEEQHTHAEDHHKPTVH